MNLSLSARDFSDLGGQVQDAIQFLSDNNSELRRLRAYSEVEGMIVDFPVVAPDVLVHTSEFPARLLFVLGDLNIDLAISAYVKSELK